MNQVDREYEMIAASYAAKLRFMTYGLNLPPHVSQQVKDKIYADIPAFEKTIKRIAAEIRSENN